jgi:hypothetical protein
VTEGLHTVHVRISDAATGQPTPVRVRFSSPEGQTFAPLGRRTDFATGRNQDVGGNVHIDGQPFAYIDGTCEVRLPTGPVRVDVHKGPEYLPLCQYGALGPGQASLRLKIERWSNFREEGWYSGDTRAHFLTPHGALLEGAAEDLAVVNLLAAECTVRGPYGRDYVAVPNLLAFSGQRPALELPGHLVIVNTQNAHPVLGTLGLLHCHRVVYPLTLGGADSWDEWTLADWCDQCHRKGGLVVWTRSWHESQGFMYGESLADLVLGKVDALEQDFCEDAPFDVVPDWYRLLNCGLRVPLVGASGKDSNDIVLGCVRTFARLRPGEALTCKTWMEAVRAGRTFVSNGTILRLTVEGQDPGATIGLPSGTPTVHVRAEAEGTRPFGRLEIVLNGSVVAQAEAAGSPVANAAIDVRVPTSAGGWLAARCGDSPAIFDRGGQRVFAHTSPVYLVVKGSTPPVDQAALALFIDHLERMLQWVRDKARCRDEHQREHLAEVFWAAREALLRRRGG